MDRYADNEVISRLLTQKSTWAVVGLSTNTSRAAHGVSALLARLGHRIVPVHPRAETVHGQPGYRTLAEIPFPVDVADMFVNSGRVGAVVDDAIRAGVKAVWLQLDVIDRAAVARAASSGLDVVMDRCPAIEARRLGLTVIT